MLYPKIGLWILFGLSVWNILLYGKRASVSDGGWEKYGLIWQRNARIALAIFVLSGGALAALALFF